MSGVCSESLNWTREGETRCITYGAKLVRRGRGLLPAVLGALNVALEVIELTD